jgi:hypothetical protein
MEAIIQDEYTDLIEKLTVDPGSFDMMQAQYLREKLLRSHEHLLITWPVSNILDSHPDPVLLTAMRRCFQDAWYRAWRATRPVTVTWMNPRGQSRLELYAAVMRLFPSHRIEFRCAQVGRVRISRVKGLGCLSKDQILGAYLQAPTLICEVILGPMDVSENIPLCQDQQVPIQLYQDILPHGPITALSLAYHVLGRSAVIGVSRTIRRQMQRWG